MLQIQDQVDIYILKYKEELFKSSSSSIKNQEIIQKLRNYFTTAAQAGDFELQKSLNRLMSPQSLARKHLQEAGIKVPKKRGFFSYAIFLCFFLVTLIGLSFATLFYVVFPYVNSKFDSNTMSWEIKYNGNLDFGAKQTETYSGEIEVKEESRFYIEAKAFNASFKSVAQPNISYHCDFLKDSINNFDFVQRSNEIISLSFINKTAPQKCVFEVPESMTLAIEAEAVNLDVNPWDHDLQIKSSVGNINISLDASQTYDMNAFVEQGNLQGLDEFKTDTSGKKIEIYLRQGNLVL
ncbi:MAG: hypothetical protein KDD37_10080, partial [Bdellovibrionales bacterium]|nr:hypothetical protein [Bdellovibrionales bacterium]